MYSNEFTATRLNIIMQRIFGEAYEVITVKQNKNHNKFYMFVYIGDTPEIMFSKYDFNQFQWACIDKIFEAYGRIKRQMKYVPFNEFWNRLIILLNDSDQSIFD